jgi:hypothetical protein
MMSEGEPVQAEALADSTHRRLDELAHRPRSPYWLSIHDEADVAWLAALYAQSRAWSPERRRALRLERFAALLREAGLPGEASAVCTDALTEPAWPADERAALCLYKMWADLERNAGAEALEALREAVRLDPVTAGFPGQQFEPVRILGVGGAGTAVLCRNLYEDGAEVVVKLLHADGLDRKPAELFREATALRKLAKEHHDLVVGLHSYGFADPVGQRGPYLVMDYFGGVSLQRHLTARGAGLSVADFLQVGEAVARALQAAHGLGLLHRDVKPDNVLVRREGTDWRVRLIDFGLAVKCEVARHSQTAKQKTLRGQAAAGTADYAAPEQMGRRKEAVGRYSDVYGFGRFCCYALFRTTTPLNRHWRDVPAELRDILEKCVEEEPVERYQEMVPILEGFRRLQSSPRSVAEPKKTEPVAAVQRFRVDVPGKWHGRPADGGTWEEVCETPAELEARAGEVYRLSVDVSATDADLRPLSRLRSLTALQFLDLEGCEQITNAGLAHLRSLRAVQFIALYGCSRITDTGLKHLSCLTALRSLGLAGCWRITDAGLRHLSSLTALEELDLNQCEGITDVGLECLRSLAALEALSLNDCAQITDDGLGCLRSLGALRSLYLQGCSQITDAGLKHLRSLRALESLCLGESSQVTDMGLRQLGCLGTLQSLSLTGLHEITDAGLAHLRPLGALRDLALGGDNLTGAGLSQLRFLPALRSLSLISCGQITDAALSHLRSLTALESLDLTGCSQITDAGMVHLRPLIALQKLSLFYCEQITDGVVAHLRPLASLQALDLYGCEQITDAGLAALRQCLPRCDINPPHTRQ